MMLYNALTLQQFFSTNHSTPWPLFRWGCQDFNGGVLSPRGDRTFGRHTYTNQRQLRRII